MDLDNERDHNELRAMLTEMGTDVKAIRKILLGNGSLGLVSKVLILWRGSVWFFGAVALAGIGYVVSRLL